MSSGGISYTTTFSSSTTVTGSGVYTLGASGQDFYDPGTGTCDTNGYPHTYAANSSCTSVVYFTPTRAGNRMGAEVLYTSTPGAYFYGLVNGIGNAPQLTFASATPAVSTLATGLAAYGAALDGAGDLWVSNSSGGVVDEFVPVAGVYPNSPTYSFTGFTSPQGIAIDGLGNVYVGDGGKGYVWRLNATNGTVPPGTAPSAYVSFLSAGSQPIAVALDPTGATLYFTGIYSNSNYLVYCTIASGSCGLVESFAAPQGLTIDAAGYKYVVDSSAKAVYRLAATTGSTALTTVVAGLTQPSGVAVDAAGDLYVTDKVTGGSGAGTVTEYIATNGMVSTASASRSLATGLYGPAGVALDSSGNVYIGDTSNNAVRLLTLSTSPFVLFPTTANGGSSASRAVTLQNIGNLALTLNVPSSGTNPSAAGQYRLSSDSTCPVLTPSSATAGSLAVGATCTYAATYNPTMAGASSGYLLLADNSLGQSQATQQIHLSGSTIFGLNVSVAYAIVPKGTTSVPIYFIVGYGSNPLPTMAPTLKVNGTSVTGISCVSKAGHMNCNGTYNPSALAPGTYSIVATQPADQTYSTTSGSGTLTVTN